MPIAPETVFAELGHDAGRVGAASDHIRYALAEAAVYVSPTPWGKRAPRSPSALPEMIPDRILDSPNLRVVV
jgi:hypothetical protein